MTKTVLDSLGQYRLVPVVVLDEASRADGLAGALVAGGLPVAEVTFRTDAAEESIRIMAERGDVLVGAGTVLTVEQVDRAVNAGASYVVSPGLSTAVVERCGEHGVAVLPGAVTATEVQAALELGLATLKFFPAGTSGGAKAIAALAAPFGGRVLRADRRGGARQPARISGNAKRRRRGGIMDGAPRQDRRRAVERRRVVGGGCGSAGCLDGRRVMSNEEWTPVIDVRPAAECRYDAVSLGEVMLRLDPGEGRIRTAREFRAWEGGGEYNVTRGLSRAFGLPHRRGDRASPTTRWADSSRTDPCRAASIRRTSNGVTTTASAARSAMA